MTAKCASSASRSWASGTFMKVVNAARGGTVSGSIGSLSLGWRRRIAERSDILPGGGARALEPRPAPPHQRPHQNEGAADDELDAAEIDVAPAASATIDDVAHHEGAGAKPGNNRHGNAQQHQDNAEDAPARCRPDRRHRNRGRLRHSLAPAGPLRPDPGPPCV